MQRRSFHEVLDREEVVTAGGNRAFGVTVGTVCILIGAYLWLRGGTGIWWSAAGLALVICALARPVWLAPLNRLWIRLGLLLAAAVSPVVMAVLFYACMLPIGLVLRLLGKDVLRLRRDPAAPTYWTRRDPPGPSPETLKNQF